MLFEYVLDYLRSGILPSPAPGGISRSRLMQELDYYQISTKQHEITKEEQDSNGGEADAKSTAAGASDFGDVPSDPQRALLTELRDLSATAIYRLRYPTQAFLKKYWIFLTEHMRMAATRGMRSVELVFEEVLLSDTSPSQSHFSSEKAKVVYGPYSHSMGKVDVRDPAIINDLEWCIPSLFGLQAEICSGRPNALRISWAAPSSLQQADPL